MVPDADDFAFATPMLSDGLDPPDFVVGADAAARASAAGRPEAGAPGLRGSCSWLMAQVYGKRHRRDCTMVHAVGAGAAATMRSHARRSAIQSGGAE